MQRYTEESFEEAKSKPGGKEHLQKFPLSDSRMRESEVPHRASVSKLYARAGSKFGRSRN